MEPPAGERPGVFAALASFACLAAGAPPAAASGGPRVVLAYDGDEETRRGHEARLEVFVGEAAPELERLFGGGSGGPAAPIRVRLFETGRGFRAWARDRAPDLADNGGYYDGAAREVVAHVAGNPWRLVLHELAHALLGDVFGDPGFERYARPGWPVWLDEGLAEHLAARAVGADRATADRAPADRVALLAGPGGEVPVRTLLHARAADFSGPEKARYYAAAWGLVDLVLGDPALEPRARAWLRALRKGREASAAGFLEALGIGAADLEARLRGRTARHVLAAPDNEDLAAGDLEPWTRHDGGTWTRAVLPAFEWSLDVEVEAPADATVSILLGGYAGSSYPYRAVVEAGPRGVALRLVHGPGDADTAVEKPVAAPGAGVPLRLRLEERVGVLSVWVDGRHVLSAEAGVARTWGLSLVGLRVDGGGGGGGFGARRMVLSRGRRYASLP